MYLIHRGPGIHNNVKYWIKPNREPIKNGEDPRVFHSEVQNRPDSITVRTPDKEIDLKNDFVLAMIGYQPDLTFLGSMGITLQPETQRPLTNNETLESERKGIYLAGVIVAGMHTNEIFIENGRFHGKKIADAIAAAI